MLRFPTPSVLLALSLGMLATPASAAPIVLSEQASALGVDFTWSDSWLYGDLGAGVALEDLDGDGDLDLVFATKSGMPLRVYLRGTDGRYTDASDRFGLSAGVDHKQVLFADLDEDGNRELILGCWIPAGSSSFFRRARGDLLQFGKRGFRGGAGDDLHGQRFAHRDRCR